MSAAQPSARQAPQEEQSALPPLPPDHGFVEGDRVEIRVYGQGRIHGTVKHIDTRIGKKLYRGLVVIADSDKRFYTLDPKIARKLPPQAPKENPPTAT